MIKIEKTSHKIWGNCFFISNDKASLLIPNQFGPRIILFALKGKKNIFSEFPNDISKINSNEWTSYGGHRLWHAPEHIIRTYQPDNKPVRIETNKDVIEITQEIECLTGIQKMIVIRMDKNEPCVEVIHRLINQNNFPIKTSPWAISVMSKGGIAVVPFPQKNEHKSNLNAEFTISVWAYTDLSDSRLSFKKEYFLLKHDHMRNSPQKIGFKNCAKWAAFLNEGQVFVKTFNVIQNDIFPNNSNSLELYTDGDKLEIETLGPICSVQPNHYVELTEKWFLFAKEKDFHKVDDDFGKYIPKIEDLIY